MAKKAYIGVPTEVPIYETSTTTENANITSTNISKYFTLSSTNSFIGSGSTFTGTTTKGTVNTVSLTLTALYNTQISFSCTITSYQNYSGTNTFTVSKNNTVIETLSKKSASSTYKGSLNKGDTITFSLYNAGGGNSLLGSQIAGTFSNMTITAEVLNQVQVGTELKNVARKIKKGYIGINTEIPIYKIGTINVNITASNIGTCFTVTNGTYYFKGSGSTFTTNNGGIHSSTAQTTLTALSDMDVSFNYSYSSESGYDKFTLTVAGTVVKNGVSGATTTGTYNKTLTAGQTIVFQYTKDGSANGGDDKCTFSNMIVTKQEIIQIGSEFKEVARKIKRAYIGIGGIARPCWSGGELAYYGTITSLSSARHSLAATTIGNYALFSGGYGSTAVDAYDTALTRTTPTVLSTARYDLAATTIGDYALFGGGRTNSSTYITTVDAYNTSLTQTRVTALSSARYALAATTIGDYALFGGGSSSSYLSKVDAYNTSLTRSTPTALSEARRALNATTIGNYALFAGGVGSNSHTSTVDAYNKSLTRTVPTALSAARAGAEATTVGNYALFAGGFGNSTYYTTVDVYNTSLTKTAATALSIERGSLAATTVGNYALFGGGFAGSNYLRDAVDVYNTSLTRTTTTALSVARYNLAATSIGNYALFGGGQTSSSYKTVDAYTVA